MKKEPVAIVTSIVGAAEALIVLLTVGGIISSAVAVAASAFVIAVAGIFGYGAAGAISERLRVPWSARERVWALRDPKATLDPDYPQPYDEERRA